MAIKDLFDTNISLTRYIEPVISYGQIQPERLKSEITEYVATKAIQEQFGELLRAMYNAMDSGGEHEVGVWVSGFYGSGKSSFTKYLGFAFDESIKVDGQPFVRYLQDRIDDAEVKPLFTSIAKRFPAAVVMVDLASDMIAGSTMEDIATVLYYKVLQWAGYSQNLKVAALERKLEKDGKITAFYARFTELLPGSTWTENHNDPLLMDELIPSLAHEFYPALYKTESSFTSATSGFMKSLEEQVQEMLDIIKTKSQKDHVLFIIDEVGQYVSSRPSLITNLDGLAKLIKRLGDGRAWIFATAQQTLIEDDRRAAINSAELFKLKDRFPIRIDLESRDIKEICYRRLLAKSPLGTETLGKLFDQKGQALRFATSLEDAAYYEEDFDRTSFINLYPFLPAHFEILLRLLGALAKHQGGLGLRSAIKVVRDIMVEEGRNRPRAADREIGWLATMVTIFDALEKDIERAASSIYKASRAVLVRFPGSVIHDEIAKCVAILQILGNLPITSKNVAALMHGSLDEDPRTDKVKKAIEEMVADPMIPLSEEKGRYHFLSEKLRDIEVERGEIPRKSSELLRIRNEALRNAIDPLPSVIIHGSMAVRAGLKVQVSGIPVGLAGEGNDIQMIVEFASAAEFETANARLLNESRTKGSQNVIFLLAPTNPELDELAGDIWQSFRIAELHRSDADAEVREYCKRQEDWVADLESKLKQGLLALLMKGAFIHQGSTSAVASLDEGFTQAAKRMLSSAADLVFSRYDEAPVRTDTQLAERFLRLPNLSSVSSATDPLGLVQVVNGQPTINGAHKAIVSIKDHLERFGSREGKALLEVFSSPPFGWSQDTLRYLFAAMLMAGIIELKVSGHQVRTNGQLALDALKTNRSFGGNVSVSLRESPIGIADLSRASTRVSTLIGQTVNPLEPEICAAVQKHFPKFQAGLGALAERLSALGTKGAERARDAASEISTMLMNDGSDAPRDLGAESSTLNDSLEWSTKVLKNLDSGLDASIRSLQRFERFLGKGLPDTGIPGELKHSAAQDLSRFTEMLGASDFHERGSEFRGILTELENLVRDATVKLAESQKSKIHVARLGLIDLPEWKVLPQETQNSLIAQVEALEIEASEDLDGFQSRMSLDYDIGMTIDTLSKAVRSKGQEIIRERTEDERRKGATFRRMEKLPSNIVSPKQLDELISKVSELKTESAGFSTLDIVLTLEEK